MVYGGDKEQLDEELAAFPVSSETIEKPLEPPSALKTREIESKKMSENIQNVDDNELKIANEKIESNDVVGEDHSEDSAVHDKNSAVQEQISGVNEQMSGEHKNYTEMCGEQLNNILQILVTVTELNDKIEVKIQILIYNKAIAKQLVNIFLLEHVNILVKFMLFSLKVVLLLGKYEY